jgi:hypothetical protein
MADKKSILEEALLDINHIQNALNANTKEILRSVAKEEINGVVKESLEEEIYEEEEMDETMDEGMGEPMEGSMGGSMEEESYMEEEEEDLDEEGEFGMDDIESSEELDMTDASDDEVIAIYKKMSGDDEIEIVGDELRLNITEPGEYVVKLNGAEDMGGEDMEDELELEPADDMLGGEDEEDMDMEDTDEEGEEGDYDYEIEMDDEEDMEDEEGMEDMEDMEDMDDEEEMEGSEEESEEDEEEIEESLGYTRGYAGRQGARKNGAAHLPKPKAESVNEAIAAKKLVSETAKKYNALLTEATKLKSENNEFRTALKEFRTKLVETVVFNSNLTYVTKLFMEHSTTKGEKDSILKRFDEVSNLKESKKLYKNIANELESRKPISEAVENKIIKEATSGVSRQIVENTAYVDPSTKRIMDLINRVEKR